MKYFLIGQILAVLGYLVYYASRNCKEKPRMVGWESISKFIIIISFGFLMDITGMVSNTITMFRGILIYIKEKKQKKFYAAYVVILLACLMSGIITYRNPFSSCAYIAAIITTTAAWFGNPQQIRKWGIIASIFYLIFQISIRNIMGILFETGTILACCYSFIHNRKAYTFCRK